MAKQGTAMALMGPRELSTAEAAEPPTLHSQAEKVAALFPDEEVEAAPRPPSTPSAPLCCRHSSGYLSWMKDV